MISRITSHIDQLLEIIQTLLQSVGALLVAWSGYQASQWSSVQSTANSASIRRTTEAAQEATLAGQDRLVDLVAYEKWLDAEAEQLARQAAQASNNSSQYICYTLWFATAIFFAGISKAFKRLALQIATLVMSFVLILMGAIQLLVAPTA